MEQNPSYQLRAYRRLFSRKNRKVSVPILLKRKCYYIFDPFLRYKKKTIHVGPLLRRLSRFIEESKRKVQFLRGYERSSNILLLLIVPL